MTVPSSAHILPPTEQYPLSHPPGGMNACQPLHSRTPLRSAPTWDPPGGGALSLVESLEGGGGESFLRPSLVELKDHCQLFVSQNLLFSWQLHAGLGNSQKCFLSAHSLNERTEIAEGEKDGVRGHLKTPLDLVQPFTATGTGTSLGREAVRIAEIFPLSNLKARSWTSSPPNPWAWIKGCIFLSSFSIRHGHSIDGA